MVQISMLCAINLNSVVKNILITIITVFSYVIGYSQVSDSLTESEKARIEILNRFNHFINEELPDFKFIDDKGNIRNLYDYNQKVILLDFWATWCGPCIATIPHQKKYIIDSECISAKIDSISQPSMVDYQFIAHRLDVRGIFESSPDC